MVLTVILLPKAPYIIILINNIYRGITNTMHIKKRKLNEITIF